MLGPAGTRGRDSSFTGGCHLRILHLKGARDKVTITVICGGLCCSEGEEATALYGAGALNQPEQ